jgi:hypothetical protein
MMALRVKRVRRNPGAQTGGISVAVYWVSGLFALSGVVLGGIFAEIRASRESRARESSELTSLKRETYSRAIHQVELVASRVARWAGTSDEKRPERSHAFWDELTLAYQITNEIRLIARTQEPADAMKRVLSIYRTAVENDNRKLPKPRDQVNEMINSFRKDLDLSP